MERPGGSNRTLQFPPLKSFSKVSINVAKFNALAQRVNDLTPSEDAEDPQTLRVESILRTSLLVVLDITLAYLLGAPVSTCFSTNPQRHTGAAKLI